MGRVERRVVRERECGKSGECEGKGRVCDDEGVSVREKELIMRERVR